VAYAVIWSDDAEADLEGIIQYIATQGSIPSAAGVVSAIVTAVNRLSDFPHSGRVAPKLKSLALREIFVFDYRIVYKVGDDRVEVRMIIHTRRKFPPKKEMHRLR
jgi:toxin ParE1/3/4